MRLASPGWETPARPLTDAERDRYARRLRFPPELEGSFRAACYRQVLPGLRVALLLAVLIVVVQGLVAHYRAGYPAAAALAGSAGRAAPFLLAFYLTYRPGFERYWQTYFVGLVVVGAPVGMLALGQIAAATPYLHASSARLGYITTIVLYAMLVWAGILRM